jgi:hypothetical protein
MNENNLAIVKIKGGFGNQLFQFCFANELTQRGYKTYIDTSFFNKTSSEFLREDTTERELVLPLDYFKLSEVPYRIKIFIKIMERIVYSKFLKNRSDNFFKKFLYTHKGYEFEQEKIHKINIFDGYWKSSLYLENQIDFMKKSLSKNSEILKYINNSPPQTSVMIHVRRRDFVNNNWDLSIDYYKNAFKYLDKHLKDYFFDVFTDDYSWVQGNKQFQNAKNIYYEGEGKNISPIIDFARMLNYKNFVTANSSFSVIPAFLKADEDSIVIVPDPWYESSSHPTLHRENWIKIKNI